jgi:hypothetical protein
LFIALPIRLLEMPHGLNQLPKVKLSLELVIRVTVVLPLVHVKQVVVGLLSQAHAQLFIVLLIPPVDMQLGHKPWLKDKQ